MLTRVTVDLDDGTSWVRVSRGVGDPGIVALYERLCNEEIVGFKVELDGGCEQDWTEI